LGDPTLEEEDANPDSRVHSRKYQLATAQPTPSESPSFNLGASDDKEDKQTIAQEEFSPNAEDPPCSFPTQEAVADVDEAADAPSTRRHSGLNQSKL